MWPAAPLLSPPTSSVIHLTHELLAWCLILHISFPPLRYLAKQLPFCSWLICGSTLWLFASSAQPKPELLNCLVFLFSIGSNVYFHFSVPAMAAGVTLLTDRPNAVSDFQRKEIRAEMETGKWALLLSLFYHENKTGVLCSVVCVALRLNSKVNLHWPIQIF